MKVKGILLIKRYVIIKAALVVLFITSSNAQEEFLLSNNLRGVQHLGIPVTDIDVAKRWYTDYTDFSPRRHEGFRPVMCTRHCLCSP
ncbi:MAG: hypothetical protein ABII09_10735 [Planctomycetota bacterium]